LYVVAEVPGEVVSEILRTSVDLPATEDVEAVVVEEEDAAGALAIGSAEGAHVDTLRSTMQRVGARIAGAVVHLRRFDRLDELRRPRIGLRVEDVDPRRAQARHDQIPPLDVRMRRPGTQGRAARVPAEMVQLVASVRHGDAIDDGTVGG
jgi:hypothetical protein